MRNLLLPFATLVAVVAIAACGGPSNQQITAAKQARFSGDKVLLFRTAKAAVEEKSKIGKADEGALGFQTAGRWYTNEGILAPGSDEDFKSIPDKSLRITLVVRLLADGENWIVSVEASMLRKQSGSPQPQPIAIDDASVPGFVQGQVDAMQFEIYNALKQYEVKSPGGIAPAPTPTAAPAPAPAPAAEPAPAPATP